MRFSLFVFVLFALTTPIFAAETSSANDVSARKLWSLKLPTIKIPTIKIPTIKLPPVKVPTVKVPTLKDILKYLPNPFTPNPPTKFRGDIPRVNLPPTTPNPPVFCLRAPCPGQLSPPPVVKAPYFGIPSFPKPVVGGYPIPAKPIAPVTPPVVKSPGVIELPLPVGKIGTIGKIDPVVKSKPVAPNLPLYCQGGTCPTPIKPVAPNLPLYCQGGTCPGSKPRPLIKSPPSRPSDIIIPIHVGGLSKRSLADCSDGKIACPVPGLLHGFDCVDIRNDPHQCGDCQGELLLFLLISLQTLSLSLTLTSSHSLRLQS